jgi:LmbE family N-acetylglucosaminyl deacetylase
MLGLKFEEMKRSGFKILCLGAHSDDIEIGCGGTIMRLLEEMRTEFYWIVFCADKRRAREAKASAQSILKNAQKKKIVVKKFHNGFFPYQGEVIKKYFESLKREFSPDLIFTHYRDDRHQDHRTISDLTWNTYRNHLILEYEIPKYDGDFGTPNFFFKIPNEICKRKKDLLMEYYGSQQEKHWFKEELLYAIMRLRGMETGGASEYAEAFYCRKAVL